MFQLSDFYCRCAGDVRKDAVLTAGSACTSDLNMTLKS